MAIVLGLTGVIGTGKSAAAEYLAATHDYAVIDADEVGHRLLAQPGRVHDEILRVFGTVYRPKLARLVFQDHEQLTRLNKLLHPEMYKIIEEEKSRLLQTGKNVLIEAALLFQIGLDRFCDKIVCLQSENEVIFARLIEKGLVKKQINERLANAPAIPLEECLVLENNGTLAELQKKLADLISVQN